AIDVALQNLALNELKLITVLSRFEQICLLSRQLTEGCQVFFEGTNPDVSPQRQTARSSRTDSRAGRKPFKIKNDDFESLVQRLLPAKRPDSILRDQGLVFLIR